MDTMRERVTALILNTGGSPEVVAGVLAIVAEDREKLVAALEPFAVFAKEYLSNKSKMVPKDGEVYSVAFTSPTPVSIKVEHLRAALASVGK